MMNRHRILCLFVFLLLPSVPESVFRPYRAAPQLLRHRRCAYALRSEQVNYSAFLPTTHVISIPGMRIRSIALKPGLLPFYTARILAKVSQCLRASNNLRGTALLALTTKCIIRQSWLTQWWADKQKPHLVLTASGIGLDAQHSRLDGLHDQLCGFFTSLKEASIQSEEVNTAKQTLLDEANLTMQSTPNVIACHIFDCFMANPTLARLDQDEEANVRGIPYHALNQLHLPSMTTEEVDEVIQDWSRAPFEIFLVTKDDSHSVEDILDAFITLWETQLPRTDAPLSFPKTSFPTNGTCVHFSCSGSTLEMVPLLVINLGPLSPKSLVAAEFIGAHLSNYNAIPNLFFDCDWAPCAGCTIVMIKVRHAPSIHRLEDGTNRLMLLQRTAEQFDSLFLSHYLEGALPENWRTFLGEREERRNFETWGQNLNRNPAERYIDWITTLFEKESVFAKLSTLEQESLRSDQVNGTLYQEVFYLIKSSLITGKKRFDIWNFIGSQHVE
ncbi:hypothetical protein [Candidatus Similichlamydia laticola]|uniref:Uncharacterized protein n=1 Tax=Candidatus Similichlamydia laticola TaxID=2170265 RepID=A0A369K9M0_9BACT|nr:hypothetical protein [Candidatus Similichlamydia laticola]RDB31299.1 hypothetical protein HAT2_00598 [Candidatus Similichlamydia laticola]